MYRQVGALRGYCVDHRVPSRERQNPPNRDLVGGFWAHLPTHIVMQSGTGVQHLHNRAS